MFDDLTRELVRNNSDEQAHYLNPLQEQSSLPPDAGDNPFD
ncbi:hypothetical protein [Winogradskyella sp.]